MEPSLDEMEFYIKLSGWKYDMGYWTNSEGVTSLTVEYAYMRQRWWDGFKDILVNSKVQFGEKS